jgi:Zn-dependent peptidase ImmA (M78 family)
MTPRCQLTFTDTKDLAERQAARLRQLLGTVEGIDEADFAGLPRLQIVREPLPTSGLSYWNGQTWVIVLNRDDSPARQRYTLAHEYKHIVDHGAAKQLYRSQWEAERAADYFAACLLMPKPELKRVFCNLTQDLRWLARHFGVSQSALRYRLEQIGLVDPQIFTRERCARPVSTPSWQSQRFKPVPMNRSHA